MHAATLQIELHLPSCHSLKEKRAIVKPIVEGLRHRFSVAAAEVDHLDLWQRTSIGVAVVSGQASHIRDVLEACERFVWSFPEVTVLDVDERWLGE